MTFSKGICFEERVPVLVWMKVQVWCKVKADFVTTYDVPNVCLRPGICHESNEHFTASNDLNFDSCSQMCHGNSKNHTYLVPQLIASLSEFLSGLISFAFLYVSHQKG